MMPTIDPHVKTLQGLDLPRLTRDSEMLWYPVITRTCVFPIYEGVESNDKEDGWRDLVGVLDPHRPIFCGGIDDDAYEVALERSREKRMRDLPSFDRWDNGCMEI